MNKQNKILLGVLALIVACTIGYALFSESITISGTASASGSFDVVPSCQTITAETIRTNFNSTASLEGGYTNYTCSISDNKATFGASFSYPGATKYVMIKQYNNGNMTATLNTGDISETVVSKVYDKTSNEILETHDSANSNVDITWGYWIYFETANHTLIYETNPLTANFINVDTGVVTLKPGESMYLIYMLKWNENNGYLTQEDFKTKYITHENTTTFEWTQAQ